MSDTNPFQVLFVITAIMLIVTGSFGIIAPSFGISVPASPTFPSFPDLNAQGSVNATYPFSETHNVTTSGIGITGYGDSDPVYFNTFNPDKRVFFHLRAISGSYVVVQRLGTNIIIPWWYDEDIFFTNGTSIYPSPQTIVDNYNGTYSTFVVDQGNNEYEATLEFSPIAGYGNMADSWNTGNGFTLWIHGSAYAPADWLAQVSAYLTFIGAIIGYTLYFIWYMIQMASALFVVIGLVPALAYGITALVIIILVGSILLFIRGGINK
jgi:hypothetical protein